MIFCVEDDNSIRELMIYTLNAAGFEAKGFPDSSEFYDALKSETPELIMLDIMLPGDDGITILKKLKSVSETEEIPIIMATAKGTEYDKVIGLDLGADDYLAKPFGMMEMISRVKAVLRRSAPKKEKSSIKIGSLELNLKEHSVISEGEYIQLTLKEYEILCLLMKNPKVVFTREELLQKIWDVYYTGETRTVDVHVNTLRNKLGSCGEYIETVRGVGYRMRVSA